MTSLNKQYQGQHLCFDASLTDSLSFADAAICILVNVNSMTVSMRTMIQYEKMVWQHHQQQCAALHVKSNTASKDVINMNCACSNCKLVSDRDKLFFLCSA